MSEKNQRDDRMSESDWTRMGTEELEFKHRSDNLIPEGMTAEVWAKTPVTVKSLILDALRVRPPKRRT